jgi:hypothetical protein
MNRFISLDCMVRDPTDAGTSRTDPLRLGRPMDVPRITAGSSPVAIMADGVTPFGAGFPRQSWYCVDFSGLQWTGRAEGLQLFLQFGCGYG